MPTGKHGSPLRYLIKWTKFGVVTWKRVPALNATFTTTLLAGESVITVWEDTLRRYFKIQDGNGMVLRLGTSADTEDLDPLFDEIKRRAVEPNRSIASLMRVG